MLRPDLSVAPQPSEPPAEARPAPLPTVATVASPPASATETPVVSAAARDATAWSAGSGVRAANSSLAATIPGPVPVPTRRRLPLRWILVGAFFLVPAIAGSIANSNWSRASTGEIAEGGDLFAADLRAGDCFDLKDPKAEQIDDVHAVPCTAEHEYETFFTGSMPAGTFPTQAATDAWISGNCEPAYKTYIGTAYQDSHLEVYILTPSSDAWNNGDRSVQCSVYDPSHERLTQSLKGAAR